MMATNAEDLFVVHCMHHAKDEQWLNCISDFASGMAVYIAYAGWQVSALGGITPTYDIYDSENYPLVLLSPLPHPFAPDP